jgi:hypothetical protein
MYKTFFKNITLKEIKVFTRTRQEEKITCITELNQLCYWSLQNSTLGVLVAESGPPRPGGGGGVGAQRGGGGGGGF